MKKLLTITFVLALAVSLTACGQTETEKRGNELADKVAEKLDKVTTMTNDEMADKMAEGMKEAMGDEYSDEVGDSMKEALANGNAMGAMKDELNKMKENLPKSIQVMTFYKSCLEEAETKEGAIICYKKADELSDELGLPDEEDKEFNPDEEFGDWTEVDKKATLATLELGLKSMEAFANSDEF